MLPTPLITAPDLLERLQADASPVLLDCSFDLADTEAGERQWRAGHVPGSRHVHLDRDLSAARTGRNGRHPLPDRQAFAQRVGAWGIAADTDVVVFDGQGGPYAARAWWMLRWLGHAPVSVLDGGLRAWLEAGGSLVTDPPGPQPRPAYPARSPAMPSISADMLLAAGPRWRVLDARQAERFRGEVEPLDPIAGHIPGALNRFFKDNLGADGRFLPPADLRSAFQALASSPAEVVHQCGSGVTACHNLLAMEVAGLHGSQLYPGSWSEWVADPARPVARGWGT
jgi:thiosulfate/3-mercaptopyruvate sulfurtransferase